MGSANARAKGASPIRPLAEASRGQMLRGGRSGPSDWKVGAGAAKDGNTVAAVSCGSGTTGAALGKGGTEQQAEQRLQVSVPAVPS